MYFEPLLQKSGLGAKCGAGESPAGSKKVYHFCSIAPKVSIKLKYISLYILYVI
jgi:hypothetical protein